MLTKRLIISIEVRNGHAVRAVAGGRARDDVDPVQRALQVESEGADELVFLDTSDTIEGRRRLLELVRETARGLYIPLTVSGGIHEVGDMELALEAGADKVSINTAAVQRPAVITEAALRFGSHSVVASVDTRMEKRSVENAMRSSVAAAGLVSAAPPAAEWYRVYTHGGSTPTMLDAISWARQCAELGAGEVVLTSIDQGDGGDGYDLELTGRVVETLSVPVVASGGATTPEHVRDAFLLAGADAALVADGFDRGRTGVAAIKQLLSAAGVPVRVAATA